jgi:dihydrolipoamide dehydrogenase
MSPTKLNKGIEFLMKKNKIEHIVATPRSSAGQGRQALQGGDLRLQGAGRADRCPREPAKAARDDHRDNILIATGSVARDLPFAKFDGDSIWGAREAMYNKEQARRS